MVYSRQEYAEHIVRICRDLNAQGFLAAADGNVSVKISDTEIMITPSGKSKARINVSDMAIITTDGRTISGHPSGERLMHLAIYKHAPLAKAVVHAHPPTAIAWSIARPDLTELPSGAMSELILAVGAIPIVPYARPGTEEMGHVLKNYLPERRVMILARHGALSWGEDLEEAHGGMERLEHAAKILKLAEELGGITSLHEMELKALREMRQKMGPKTL